MLLSRLRPAKKKQQLEAAKAKNKLPELDEFLVKRDYAGAISLLEFKQKSGQRDIQTDLWLGHCYFRAGEYRKAAELYEWMLSQDKYPQEVYVYLGCCFFYLGMYEEARESAEKGPQSGLQNRLLFHVAHKLENEKGLMGHHARLQNTMEDQLSLASIHYMRMHYQQAVEIYKKILVSNKAFIAVNIYLALCYYKLDYYDVSLEILQVYLKHFPDSPAALNLKACNLFRLFNPKAAEAEMEHLYRQINNLYPFARDLIRLNMVVFRNGEGALQVLPSLLDIVREARMNLIIYHLRREDVDVALPLVEELVPQAPPEFLLKAIVYTLIGYDKLSKDHIKISQDYFKIVGESAAECDTIAGRQAMASYFFLQQQHDEVMVYLGSIKSYFYNDDTFNYNYGQSAVMVGNYTEGEQALVAVQNEKLKKKLPYILCLARALINNKKAESTWDLHKKMKNASESFALLRLIANDSYKVGEYYTSAKAYDAMERVDPNPEYWEGKRGACCGLFKQLTKGTAKL